MKRRASISVAALVAATAALAQQATYPRTLTLTTAMGTTLEMVLVEGGAFPMGAQSRDRDKRNYDADASSDEGPVHTVSLPSFYIAKYETTNEVWAEVMGGSIDDDTKDFAKGGVKFSDARLFVEQAGVVFSYVPDGATFDLPTEEQWEYAARGGKGQEAHKYAGSDNADDVAVYGGTTEKPGKVGTRRPNSLGLYDMSGNAQEWTKSDYKEYPGGAPVASARYERRVVRGGGADSRRADLLRVSARSYFSTASAMQYHGLRVVLNLPSAPSALPVQPGRDGVAAPRLVVTRHGLAISAQDGKVVDLLGRQVRAAR